MMESDADSLSKSRKRRLARNVAIWFAISNILALLVFSYRYLDDLVRFRSDTFVTRLIEEVTGAYAITLVFILVAFLVRRYPISRANWPRRVPLYLALAVLTSFIDTSLMALSRHFIFAVAGLGPYDYGAMPLRYVMEFANYLITFTIWVGLVHLFDHYRASRTRELRFSQLETQLAQANLAALQAQIHPHFLFNALNTISATIYEDVPAADAMIAKLSDFLRVALNASRTQEVTLREELEFLDLYLAVMRPRFEERLAIEFDIEHGIETALTPKLILQPIVENSIKHAADPDSGAVSIAVRAARRNGSLVLEVEDNGPGWSDSVATSQGGGIGLTNTRERLRNLYGERHNLSLRSVNGRGLIVNVTLPFRTISAPGTSGRSSESI